MTRDEVIQMARSAGFNAHGLPLPHWVEPFAAIVEAATIERCAKVCDDLHWTWHIGDDSGPKECAAAIRSLK